MSTFSPQKSTFKTNCKISFINDKLTFVFSFNNPSILDFKIVFENILKIVSFVISSLKYSPSN